jgi:hypothetical protein
VWKLRLGKKVLAKHTRKWQSLSLTLDLIPVTVFVCIWEGGSQNRKAASLSFEYFFLSPHQPGTKSPITKLVSLYPLATKGLGPAG